ncbi:TnsA endonuclease N-terminal domain-containing protein [Acinetobacter colistiniresistens]|uniref:TnsA endonuclease N-terminal domain-containing protein n=1 Tax=Acinetobacter colistiniresistens TaxID=280145 RepID=UPI00125034DF|nr:TnsA endonuclease N-terminal domain-containing protein [Acinetobacter colistiniresistens]
MKRISDEYSPVRKSQTVYGSISVNYAFRGEKTIWCESTLERDFLIKQEFNSNVIDIVSQPITIPYITELGNESTYTPDFLVQFSSANCDDFEEITCPLLIEIKPRKKLIEDWNKLKPKFKAAHAFAKEKGWKFRIINETRLYDQYWRNINFLKRFRRSHVDVYDEQTLIETLDSLGQSTINQLPAHIFKDKTNILRGIHQVWALVAKRKIMCDLYCPLTAETVIWVNQDDVLTRRF